MSPVDTYVASLPDKERQVVMHMYAVIKDALPALEPGVSYGMPTLLYKGKGFISIMSTKKFLSLYPFSGTIVAELQGELASYECTKASIHFSVEHPISDELLRKIVATRLRQAELPTAR